MNTPLTTPPTREALGKDNWYARQKFVDGVGNLNQAVAQIQTLVGLNSSVAGAIDGNLSFGNLSAGQVQGNLKTELIAGTAPATINTPFTLAHTLGKIPNGFVVVQSSGASRFYGTAAGQAWTTAQLTILCDTASVIYVILVL